MKRTTRMSLVFFAVAIIAAAAALLAVVGTHDLGVVFIGIAIALPFVIGIYVVTFRLVGQDMARWRKRYGSRQR
jgi:hypothetical protein